ncbi:MAG: ABC transporter ATP-binding protein [Mycoplasmataceae bacterium]|jgi:ABC-2 type transport system ATP-binding protein|nr:ABC transporter ATP-binding protein [Mycoplasmataceae bacterium]
MTIKKDLAIEKMIDVQGLYFYDGNKKILDNISFVVPKGKVCAFIGPNGAGKTSTIKCITTLYTFNQGTIFINNINNKNHESLSCIGYVPEKENFPKMSAIDYFGEIAQYNGVDYNDIKSRVNQLADFFGVSDILTTNLSALSSGQKKKMLIMQSLLHNPSTLIMDEPTDNMDPSSRLLFFNLVKRLKKEGKTLLISSHNLSEIQLYVDYVIMIVEGKIVYQGKLDKKNLYALYEKYDLHNKENLQPTNKTSSLEFLK